MSRLPQEDLFESTKMSFGEHLEELRGALFRSLIFLVIGVLLGLLVSNQVVQKIQGPLADALKKYYIDDAKSDLEAKYGEPSQELVDFLEDEKIIFEEIYFEQTELARLNSLAQEIPQTSESEKADEQTEMAPAEIKIIDNIGTPNANLVKTRIWKPINAKVKTLNAHEAFMIYLKAATITGAVIASPFIFYQIWNFVAAGLYPHEKNYVYIYMPISLGLFLGGVYLAFEHVFEPVLTFLFSFNRMMNIDPDPRISEWLSFVLFLPLGFGVSFQLPLVMLLLNRINVFSVEVYLSKWRVAVLVIFVLAMFLTPSDPISMLMLAAPLTILYFGGIAMCQWMPKRKSPFGQGYDPS